MLPEMLPYTLYHSYHQTTNVLRAAYGSVSVGIRRAISTTIVKTLGRVAPCMFVERIFRRCNGVARTSVHANFHLYQSWSS